MKPATLFPLRFSLFTRALLLGAVSTGLACAQDADRDGIPDASDPFPSTNAVVADPDGNNNLPASLQTGLIGRWDCQQIVPTGGYHGFADLAGNDQPLACRSLSMSLDPAGIISKAALFDGGNDHLAAPGTLFHNRAAFTTSLWFKTAPGAIQNKPGTIHTVFFACNAALDVYPELVVTIYKGAAGSLTQKIVVSRYIGSTLSMTFYGEIPPADYLDDGYWHHLAYVKNGNNNRLFINGVKIKESNLGNATLTSTSAGYLCFGKTVPVATDQGHTFRGSMDRLRFYSRNLSDTEIAALYQQDSDRDGFWDVSENEWMGTYPVSPYYWQNPELDTDRDGLPDSWERLYGLDPLIATGIHGGTGDPDGDGIPNQSEYALGFHPKNTNTNGTADATKDRDGDGMKDWQEAATLQWKWDQTQSKFTFTKVLDWQLPDANGDVDKDGLTNIIELNTYKTNPDHWDTDGDLLPDDWEVANGLNPNLSTGSHGGDGDLDNDGLSNYKEWTFSTKAGQGGADTDRDGTSDGHEATQGSNPTDASDGGRAPSADELREFKIIIGDPSGSHSERWRVEVRDLATGQIIVNHASRKYGELSAESESVFKQFRKGKAYEFKLIWMGTDPEKIKQDPEGKLYPDYDWALEVSYKNEAGAWVKVKSPTSDGYLVLDPWNPQTKQLTANNVKLLVDRNELQYPWEGKPDRTEQYQKQIVPHRVNLVPVEVASMDRYLSGSIPESMIENFGGESKFGLVFRNPSSGETYSFNKLSEAHIYDDPFGATDEDEDKFLSNSEIAAWANGPNSASKELTQDVVFYRKDGNLHFRTLFDQAGAIEIGIIKDGQEIGKIDWTLNPDAQIADLLETVDNILSGNYDDGGGVVVAAMQAGLSGDDLNALQSAAASIQSAGSSGFGGFLRRNLTIKVNIPTWEALKHNFEEGARKAGAAVDRAITIATFAGKGFCEGAWLGVKDDATSLVELGKMILNPAETAKTFYEGFKVLIELDLDGWKNVGKTLAQSFLEKGTEGVGEWGEPNDLNVASYLVGFTAGFITEQIAVTYVTAGILKAGNVGAKIGQFIRKASKGLLNGLAETAGNLIRRQAMKAKNSVFRRFSQDVLSTEDVKKLKHMLQELELLCPL